MSQLIAALRRHAANTPNSIALQDAQRTLTYAELLAMVETTASVLRGLSPRVIGLLADNGSTWAVIDLAAYLADIPIVPLPMFFSEIQLTNVLKSAGIDLVITDQPARFDPDKIIATRSSTDAPYYLQLREFTPVQLPAGTWKITFTSGTTGNPKGVCLGRGELETVAEQLRNTCAANSDDKHLCVLPLSTLLENIGGLYSPLLAGATVCLPSLHQLGLAARFGPQPEQLLDAMQAWAPTTAIMVPQLLQVLITLGRAGATMPTTLRYLAVGGAPISASLLKAAHMLGLPAYEGYGLSECASVIAVNHPQANRAGSVGRPLPHIRISFSDDGEIRVHGLRWRGYLGGDQQNTDTKNELSDFIATGDIGYLDDQGFLYIKGRKKQIFITAFGRNVAPEWVERELVAHAPILQAAVFGEARPFNCAVIVARAGATAATIESAVATANRELPDYARIHAWIPAAEPFNSSNGLATTHGRLRRDRIFARHAHSIGALYTTETKFAGDL
jgi:long-subunit acyl-CoA synthetase (AMP-forming)